MRTFFLFALVLAFAGSLIARDSTLLETGWRFQSGDPTNAGQANFNDSGWEKVSLPHCWGWEEAQQGNTNYYRGPGWYRRDLGISPQAGKRYFVRFEAAATVADVYLNGRLIGEHRGGFGAFCFEITTNLASKGRNRLAVRVSNAPEPDIAPLSGDFPVYGGLYRPVHLITTEAQNIALTDHGSPGVAWRQTSVTDTQAVLDVTTWISNGTNPCSPMTLTASVFDVNNFLIASAQQEITPSTNVTAPYFLPVIVPQPHLWNGRADPYLYNAVVELRSSNDVVDSVEQPLGLRYYSVDPDRGFFLNGKPYHLHGVDKHQDRWNKGWAVSEADLDEDIALIKEIGATVVRCAHYQHSDYFYSLCDKAGILVWAEIPQVDEINPTAAFAETSRNQLLDLIRQNLNHPSIFAWSLFNELRAGKPDPHRELQDLKIIASGEDPTRPTIAATMVNQNLPQMCKIPDLIGWNLYVGWYAGRGKLEDWGRTLDELRTTSRHGGFSVSEYGAGANILQHELYPVQPVATNQWHPEEWQALVHEAAWSAMKARPFVWGTFAWNMFDFTSPRRHEGGSVGLNDKGLVTADRRVKKDEFYFYKANWSAEPVLYITSRRFTERTNAVTDVKVYSNAAEVELLLDGKSQGKRDDSTNSVFVWKEVRLKPGENHIEARAQRDGTALADSCVWTLKAGP